MGAFRIATRLAADEAQIVKVSHQSHLLNRSEHYPIPSSHVNPSPGGPLLQPMRETLPEHQA
jgi:hypothetical protein